MRRLLALTALILAAAAPAAAQDRLAGWTSILISADWRDGAGATIPAFDNARRDLAAAFVDAGFDPNLMVQYSLRPDAPGSVTPLGALEGGVAAGQRGLAGCLIYFTSHGNPQEMVFGEHGYMNPVQMAGAVNAWCGYRPTIVVVSACFSGIFIPTLAAPNRLVMTAARRDRSSFGCGAGIQYPYFDECVLRSLPQASDFLDLAAQTRACVAQRETRDGLTPASEPQLFVGSEMQLLAPILRFRRPGG